MDYLERAEKYAAKLASSPSGHFRHMTAATRGLAIAFDEELTKLRREMDDLRNSLRKQAMRGEAE